MSGSNVVENRAEVLAVEARAPTAGLRTHPKLLTQLIGRDLLERIQLRIIRKGLLQNLATER